MALIRLGLARRTSMKIGEPCPTINSGYQATRVLTNQTSCPNVGPSRVSRGETTLPDGFWFGPKKVVVSSYYGSAGATSSHHAVEIGCGLCAPQQRNCLCAHQESAHFGSGSKKGGSGMFSFRPTGTRIAEVTDGTSQTLFVGETINNVDNFGGTSYNTNDWMDGV